VVESRARRKRRQDARSSAYYGSTGLAGYSNILYGLGPYGFGTNILIKFIQIYIELKRSFHYLLFVT